MNSFQYMSPLPPLFGALLLCCAWPQAQASVHTVEWPPRSTGQQQAASPFEDELPAPSYAAVCDRTSSCVDAASHLYQSDYVRALSGDPGATDAPLPPAEPEPNGADPNAAATTLILDGLASMVDPATASICALGLLVFGISSLTIAGRNPAPRKRKYRSLH